MLLDKRLWLACLVLVLAQLGLCVRVAGADKPSKPISIDVVPKVAMTSYNVTSTFRVKVTIPRQKDNRLWSYSASCGSEIKSSDHELNLNSAITTTWYEEFTVTEDCIFQACLHRIVEGKVKNFCDYQGVNVDEFAPP